MWACATALQPALAATAIPSAAPLRYDLVVVGGGSAGLYAAKFARRFKKSVLLVEKELYLGGKSYPASRRWH